MADVNELAEAIHAACCRWNHTDQCGWYYESWDKPGYARKLFLEQARELVRLSGQTVGECIIVMVALREVRK